MIEAMKLVEKEMSTLNAMEDLEILKCIATKVHCLADDDVVLPIIDPIPIRTKGSTKLTLKSQLEKCRKKKATKETKSQVVKEKNNGQGTIANMIYELFYF